MKESFVIFVVLLFQLTIRPRGRMDYESIAHEAVG